MAMSGNEAVATKKPQVTAYVRDEVNTALDQAAANDIRSRSQMAAILIEEALIARGYLNNQITNKESDSESKP